MTLRVRSEPARLACALQLAGAAPGVAPARLAQQARQAQQVVLDRRWRVAQLATQVAQESQAWLGLRELERVGSRFRASEGRALVAAESAAPVPVALVLEELRLVGVVLRPGARVQ